MKEQAAKLMKAIAVDVVVDRLEQDGVDQVSSTFDYDALDNKTKDWLQQAETEITVLILGVQDLSQQYGQKVIQVGQRLTAVRDRLKYKRPGGFDQWLRSKGWTTRTVYNYIDAAAKFKNFANFQNFDIAPSAIWLLSSDSVDDSVRQQAIALAEAGEKVSHAKAKKLIKDQTAAKQSSRSLTIGDIVEVQAGEFQGQQVTINNLENEFAVGKLDDGQLIAIQYSEFEQPVGAQTEIQGGESSQRPEPRSKSVNNPQSSSESLETQLRIANERNRLISGELAELKERNQSIANDLAEETAYGDSLVRFIEQIIEHLPNELQQQAQQLIAV